MKMLGRFSSSAVILLATTILSAQAFAGSVSCDPQKDSFTLNGAGFGTKPAAAPLRFETFSGASGTKIASLGWWATKDGNLQYSPAIKSGVSRALGRNVADLSMDNNGTLNLFKNGVGFKSTRKAYVNWWAYLDFTTFDGVPVQVKLLNLNRNTDPVSSDNQYPDQATSLWNDMSNVTTGTLSRYYYSSGSAPSLNYKDASGSNLNLFRTAGWYNFSVQVDQGVLGTVSGKTTLLVVGPDGTRYGVSADASNVMQINDGDYLDSIKLWQYLQFRTDFSDATSFLNAYAAGYPAGSRVNYLKKGYRCILATGPRGTFNSTPDIDTVHWQKVSDAPLTISDTVYIDSLYIDNSFARVEICDNANWSARTHCEIQIPTAWSDTQISVQLNQGTFAKGDNTFIFAFDDNGNLLNSTGIPYKIGAIPPPKNVGVNVN